MFSSEEASAPTFPAKRLILYYITDRKGLAGMPLIECIRRVAAWGADFVQIREKDLSDRALYDLTCRAVRSVRDTRCRVLVNGRADVALAAGAAGVHLPSQAAGIRAVRGCTPPGFLIGLSTHTFEEVKRAAGLGADYVLLGPVYATRSKLRYGPPLGLEVLRKAARAVRIPVLALGGIRPGRIPALLEAGAAGIAGISMFQRDIDFSSRRGHNRLEFR